MTHPTAQIERLRGVQAAAKRALAFGGESLSFGSTDLFSSEGRMDLSAGEKYWRGQLAWTWWRAGYLARQENGVDGGEERVGGQKRLRFTVAEKGKPALKRIAEDEEVALFYVASKRRGQIQDTRSELWFQPPEIRDVALPEGEAMEDRIDEEVEGPEEAAAEDEPSHVGDGALLHFLDQASAVLVKVSGQLLAVEKKLDALSSSQAPVGVDEFSVTRLAAIEKMVFDHGSHLTKLETEVKANSEFVFDATHKVEALSSSAATKMDLAAFSSELASALSKSIDAARSGSGSDPALLKALSEKLGVIETAVSRAESEIIETVVRETVGGVEHALKKSLASDVQTAVQTAVASRLDSVRDKIASGVERLVAEKLDDLGRGLKKSFEAEVARLAEVRNALDADVNERLSDLQESFDDFKDIVSTLEERLGNASIDMSVIKRAADGIGDVRDNFRALSKSIQESLDLTSTMLTTNIKAARQVADSAEGIVETAKLVSQEILSVAQLRAHLAGAPSSATFLAATAALDRIDMAEVELGSKKTALGGGLIRPLVDGDIHPVIRPSDDEEAVEEEKGADHG